ncbi:hypothetical protein L9F63_022896 [Diploptera punctata]|uniref:CHK kinase-like domain-containing protein n=1 Tax=Diploptera punctata TaxID=6984 RepID=A0AAD7ZLW5_DIPPU|nr:hypothetical protein L9F63_022896 [Diploptera punctata]
MSEATMEVPTWLNVEFLEKVFKSEDLKEDLKVVSFDTKLATAAGDNYLSLMYRVSVQITTRGQSEKRSLIIKCQPAGEAIHKVTTDYQVFEFEAKMLQEVLPAMHKLLQEANIENFSPFSAKCLYSHFGAPAHILVLEDLKETGFEMSDRAAGLNQEHCMMVMKKIAQFHAASLVLKQKNPELLEPFIDPPSKNMVLDLFSDYFKRFLPDLCKEIDENCQELNTFNERILKLAEDGIERWGEGRAGKQNEFSVLAHGDIWLNNMMFRYSPDNCLVDMRFVDYQLSLWTSPAVDLLYFLNSSPAMDLLTDQTMFIEEYHRVLGETLSALGYQHLHISLDHLNQLLESRGHFATLVVFSIRNVVMGHDEGAFDVEEVAKKDQVSFKFSRNYLESLQIQIPLLDKSGCF